MGELKYLCIHCTDTPKERKVTREDIIHWHTSPKSEGGRGWKKAGYSDLIDLKGKIINITPFNQNDVVENWEITNGVRGINGLTRHLVYVGGHKGKDTRNEEQRSSLEIYVKYMILRYPEIEVSGHNQFSNKNCPSFDVPLWLESIGVLEKNIYRQAK